MATYWIDYTNGNDANTGTSHNSTSAWKTINQYASVTVRSTGDIAYVRANQTHVSTGIVFDESGTNGPTSTSVISLIGCSATGVDTWVDGSTVQPTIWFNSTANKLTCTRQFWDFQNLKFSGSVLSANNNMCQVTYGHLNTFENCIFDQSTNASATGIATIYIQSERARFTDCTFKCHYEFDGQYATYSMVDYKNCSFWHFSSDVTSDRAVVSDSSVLSFEDCTFSTAYQYACLRIGVPSRIRFKNCTLNANILQDGYSYPQAAFVFTEDSSTLDDETISGYTGTLTRTTAVYNAAGADTSLKVTPNSTCGCVNPLYMQVDEPLMSVWAATSHTKITVNLRSESNWGAVYPTTAQLYLTAAYPNSTATGARTEVQSSQVLNSSETWTPFYMTIAPARAGFVHIYGQLGKYNSGSGCYVDIKPTCT